MTNIVNLRRWRDELRSTDREQGHGLLKAIGTDGVTRYCCLGVWLELLESDGLVSSSFDTLHGNFTFYSDSNHEDRSEVDLPNGFSQTLCQYDYDYGDVIILDVPGYTDRNAHPLHISAVAANDALGLTFKQIADCLTWNYNLDARDD